MIRVCEISKLDSASLKKEFLRIPPVFIIGSAISTFEPSVLPTGFEATQELVFRLFAENQTIQKHTNSDILDEIRKTIPFEQLFEVCPDKTKARRILSAMCDACKPNQLHQEIVKFLLDRKILSIITTNYDRCIERVLAHSDSTIPIVVKENEYGGEDPPYIFKIHGSSENEGESMVFDLKNETRLEKWKKDMLHKMVNGHFCIFFGYSGRDFEICPEIEGNDNIAGLIWCNRDPIAPSKNAEYILKKNPGKAFWMLATGDIVDFMNTVFDTDIHVSRAKTRTSDIAKRIIAEYSPEHLSIWALNILSVMGYAGTALKCATELLRGTESKSEFSRRIVANISSLHYDMGNYKQSVRYLKHHLKLTRSIPEKVAIRFSIFESRRIGVYVFSAVFSYFFASLTLVMAKSRLSYDQKIELMKMKFNRKDDLYSAIFRFLPFLQPMFRAVREKSRKKVIALADEDGDLGLKNIMKPDHVFDFFASDDNYRKEIERFRQLGRFIEETVTYRRYIEWKKRNNNARKEDLDLLEQYRDQCIQREIYPEVLKYSLLLKDEATYMRFYRKCTYSFYGKQLLLHHWSHQAH